MNIADVVKSFFVDDRVEIILFVLLLDFVLGILASLYPTIRFRLSYVADILRADVLGKVAPFLVVYAGYKYAGNHDVLVPGLDMEVVMNGAFVVVTGALAGSVLKSIRDLGLFGSTAGETESLEPIDIVAGSDPTTPNP